MASYSGLVEKALLPQTKFCIVCGTGSHRQDWQSKDNPACDSHSVEEIAKAVADAAPKFVPAAPSSPVVEKTSVVEAPTTMSKPAQ